MKILVAMLNGGFPCWIPARRDGQEDELIADICQANDLDWDAMRERGWTIHSANLDGVSEPLPLNDSAA